MAQTKTLFATLMDRGKAVMYGTIVKLIMDGDGTVLLPSDEWMTFRRWAESRKAHENMAMNRKMLFDKIDNFIAGTNSSLQTKGADPMLVRIAGGATRAGIDIADYKLPVSVEKALAEAAAEVVKTKKPSADTPAEPAAATPDAAKP